MRSVKARSVVLASRPLGEADRILRLYTRELGRVDAVVKGVRKTTSRWGGRLEPFNVCDLVLYPGRSLYTVTQAQLVDVCLRLRDEREGLTAAAVVCEAVAGLTPEHEPDERVFALLRNALKQLDAGFRGPALQAPLLLGALLKLLYEAGYMPVLERCASCGAGERALGFSAARGGLVCERCLEDAVPIAPEAVEVLREALERPLAELREAEPTAAVTEALRHVHDLYGYHTGGRLRALRFARATG
ncbi:MAG: DNA repair protein RecO [Thermoleophilia bacterium]